MGDLFANREVCDLIISDYATQKPLLYCDYANTNSTELTSESVYAFGGSGHPKRIGFNGDKGGSLTVETQIQSFQMWSMMTGGVVTKSTNLFHFDNAAARFLNDTKLDISGYKYNSGDTPEVTSLHGIEVPQHGTYLVDYAEEESICTNMRISFYRDYIPAENKLIGLCGEVELHGQAEGVSFTLTDTPHYYVFSFDDAGAGYVECIRFKLRDNCVLTKLPLSNGFRFSDETNANTLTIYCGRFPVQKGKDYVFSCRLNQSALNICRVLVGHKVFEMPEGSYDGRVTIHAGTAVADESWEIRFYMEAHTAFPTEIINICISETSYFVKREIATATATGIYLTRSCAPGTSSIFDIDDDCGTPIPHSQSTQYGPITGEGIVNGQQYIVYYTSYVPEGAQTLSMKSTTFPKSVSIAALTYMKTADEGVLPYQMRIYKAHPQASFTINNSNTGDPATLTMTFDLMADNMNNLLDLILITLSITAQPTDFYGDIGDTAVFTVDASGIGDLSYQWQRYINDAWTATTLPGNKTPTLSFEINASRAEPPYRCAITDADGNVVYSDVVHVILPSD